MFLIMSYFLLEIRKKSFSVVAAQHIPKNQHVQQPLQQKPPQKNVTQRQNPIMKAEVESHSPVKRKRTQSL